MGMRLLHRILSMDILVPPPQVVPQGVGNLEYIHQNMKQVANLRKSNLVTQSQSGVVVPVVVDNVARYYAENQKEFYQPREIPNWAPPLACVFSRMGRAISMVHVWEDDYDSIVRNVWIHSCIFSH